MINIRILSWSEENSWTTWGGQYKQQFVNRAREYTSMSNTDLKRLSRMVFEKEVHIIELDKTDSKLEASGVSHLLESMGAKVEVTKT